MEAKKEPPAKEKIRVLVYGTLVKKGRNHKKYMPEDAELIYTHAVTKEKSFLMQVFKSATTDNAYTPGVSKDGRYRIEGEVWELSVDEGLQSLHHLEEYAPKRDTSENKYNFEQVELENGEIVHIYIDNSDRPPIHEMKHLIHLDKSKNIQSWHEFKSMP